jgi:hypothetical protein
MKKVIIAIFAAWMVAGCATTMPPKQEVYGSLYEEKPLSILVMPPVNRSTKVEAKELFYSSLIVPLTLRGYYVMPPLLAMEILKEESAYDSEMFVNSSMKNVGSLFGVDAVLFTTIHDWRKTTIASQVTVEIEYTLKSAKTDEVLFSRTGDITLSMSGNSGNLLADALSGMIMTALTKEITVGRRCNIYSLGDIPAGKYHPMFMQDKASPSQPKKFSIVLTQ